MRPKRHTTIPYHPDLIADFDRLPWLHIHTLHMAVERKNGLTGRIRKRVLDDNDIAIIDVLWTEHGG